jgi:DNA-binding response OmpR family regulator
MEAKMSKKILVVDDEPNIVKAIKYILEKEEYEVIEATSGTEALLKVKQFQPALVLLDMMMPGLSGIETLKCLKTLYKDISVVMVTAVRDEKDAKETIAAGAYDYITKPIDVSYLKTSVFAKMALL